MRHLPFDQPGRFYRGNLHTHSNRSDGGLPPEEVVASYRERGYDFVALTDHFLERYDFPITDTRALRGERFTTLLGAELHGPALENGERWHIVAVGLPLDFAPTTPDETGPALAQRAAEAGAFVGIAHPAWYGLSVDDALSLEAAHAVEVYNETCAWDSDRGESWYLVDLLAARGRRIFAYAADDAHFKARPDQHAAWVQVKAEALEPEALLAALKAGHFYSSQGPEIHDIQVSGDEARVTCSPARAIFARGARTACRSALGDGLTEAILPLAPFANSYFHVTIVDAAGKRAWSNPIWLPTTS